MSKAQKLNKSQTIQALSEKSELDKKSVTKILEALQTLAQRELSAKGPGEFTVPGLVKLKVRVTAATHDRQGTNPFTKQPMLIKGKPASRKVKVSPIKALKDSVS